MKNSFSIIKKDILLWNLGGFEDFSNKNYNRKNGYPKQLTDSLIKISKKSKAEFREIKNLSDKFGIKSNSLNSTISKLRRGSKMIPKYWNVD